MALKILGGIVVAGLIAGGVIAWGLVLGVGAASVGGFAVVGAIAKGVFAAGALIMTPDGMVAIEDICVGDEVVSTCIDTFEVGVKRAVKTFIREVNQLVHIKVDGDIIHTTTDHPFYVKDIGFVDAGLLRVYDELVENNGNIVIILKVEIELCG